MHSHLPRMQESLKLDVQCQIVNIFAETSQRIVAIHHTSVQLMFEHRSKAIDRRCR